VGARKVLRCCDVLLGSGRANGPLAQLLMEPDGHKEAWSIEEIARRAGLTVDQTRCAVRCMDQLGLWSREGPADAEGYSRAMRIDIEVRRVRRFDDIPTVKSWASEWEGTDHPSPDAVGRFGDTAGFSDYANDAPQPVDHSAALTFMASFELRAIVAGDLEEAQRDYDAGSFKSASIMSGSAAEGAIADVLERRPEKLRKAIRSLGLSDMIAAAGDSNLLSSTTVDAAQVITNHRNFVHPLNVRDSKVAFDEPLARLIMALTSYVIRDLHAAEVSGAIGRFSDEG
jgi:hypothetical protein